MCRAQGEGRRGHQALAYPLRRVTMEGLTAAERSSNVYPLAWHGHSGRRVAVAQL